MSKSDIIGILLLIHSFGFLVGLVIWCNPAKFKDWKD